VQLLLMTTVHVAVAAISMLPQAAIAACAVCGNAASAVKATAVEAARRTQELREIVFMVAHGAIDEPGASEAVSSSVFSAGARSKREL
jgi:hypothetical protein